MNGKSPEPAGLALLILSEVQLGPSSHEETLLETFAN